MRPSRLGLALLAGALRCLSAAEPVAWGGNGTVLRLHTFIASNMVLQRGPQRAVLWGTAPAGALVAVRLDGANASSARARADGDWEIELEPQRAGDGHVLAFSALTAGGAHVAGPTLRNVAFGDVYLCSGQVHRIRSAHLHGQPICRPI